VSDNRPALNVRLSSENNVKYAKCDYKTRIAVCLYRARFMSTGIKQNLVSVINDFFMHCGRCYM
jgi:hypothetical protein